MSQSSTDAPAGDSRRHKAKNFSSDEDYQLCLAWRATSEDPIHGTDQSSVTFWIKVRTLAKKSLPSLGERSADSLRQRFGAISRCVSKFIGVYGSVLRLNQSGKSSEDKYMDAVDLYKKEMDVNCFKYRSCWEALKDTPKFALSGPEKRQKPDSEEEENTDVEMLEDNSPNTKNKRPIGQKAAKKMKLTNNLEERRIKSLEDLAEASKERNKLLEKHSEVLSATNDVQLMHFVTMDTSTLDPTAKEIIEIKKKQLLRQLKEDEEAYSD